MCCVYNLSHVVINIQDGLSPLYVASREGHTDVVDMLVKAGADVNQATIEVHIHVHACTKYNVNHISTKYMVYIYMQKKSLACM